MTMSVIEKPKYSPSNPRPGGKVQLDWEKLDLMLGFSASMIDCMELLGVTKDALQRRIREKYDLTFGEYRERKMAPTRIRLVQKALSLATKGDRIMLIFCLKNLCKWADRSEISSPEGQAPISINITERKIIDVVDISDDTSD